MRSLWSRWMCGSRAASALCSSTTASISSTTLAYPSARGGRHHLRRSSPLLLTSVLGNCGDGCMRDSCETHATVMFPFFFCKMHHVDPQAFYPTSVMCVSYFGLYLIIGLDVFVLVCILSSFYVSSPLYSSSAPGYIRWLALLLRRQMRTITFLDKAICRNLLTPWFQTA